MLRGEGHLVERQVLKTIGHAHEGGCSGGWPQAVQRSATRRRRSGRAEDKGGLTAGTGRGGAIYKDRSTFHFDLLPRR